MKLTRKQFLGAAATSGLASLVSARTAPLAAAENTPKKLERAAIKGATAETVRFIRETKAAAIPPAVFAQAKRCLIGGFGVILAGSTVRGSEIVRDYVRAGSDKRDATVLGAKGLTTSVAYAALANGASGHAMDFDDTQLSTTPDRTYGLLTHPTLPPLCAALAVGEAQNVSGAAFLDAFAVGFEVECKIAEAIDPAHYNNGFHRPARSARSAPRRPPPG